MEKDAESKGKGEYQAISIHMNAWPSIIHLGVFLPVRLCLNISPLSTVKEYCKVTFTYEATNQDELDLKEGDIVHLLSKVRLGPEEPGPLMLRSH